MAIYQYKILKEFNNITLEDFLNYYHLGKSKITLYKDSFFLDNKKINLNHLLKEDSILTLKTDETIGIKPFKMKLDIIYEDSYLLVLNKPKGIAIHSDGAKNLDNTLSNAVANYYKESNLDLPVWYIHRLDFDTTGLIIYAKDPLTMSYLSYLLESHLISRVYLALVHGHLLGSGTIKNPIGRDRHVNGKYRVSKTGKEAITHYESLKANKKISLIRLKLETGRTHQIRVHMASINHQLLGDELYNGSKNLIDRQALHSYYLKFIHPILKKELELYAKIPLDMKQIIDKM